MGSMRVVLAGLGVVVLWAGAFPAIQVAAPELGVIGLSLIRLLIAAVALLLVAPLLGVHLPRARDLPTVIACGFFGMTAYQLLLNAGELSVPAGTASIVVAAAPLVSAAIAVAAFGERLSSLRVVGSLICISGVALVCLARSGVSLTGSVWLVVGAMIVQGVYHPLTRTLLERYSGLEVATYAMLAGTIMTLPLAPLGWHELRSASGGAWVAALYLGLLPSALGFVLWGYAVARLPVVTSTSLLYLVPPVAVLIAFLWLGQVPTAPELVGGGIVISGVVIVTQGDRILTRIHRRQAAA